MSRAELPATRLTLICFLQDPEHARGAGRTVEQAREQFYQLYQPVIVDWCLRFGLQWSDAEDVAQEVAGKLFEEALRSYRPGQTRFRSWLKTVVHHAAVDVLRGSARRPRLMEGERLESLRSAAGLAILGEELERALPAEFETYQEVVGRVRKRVKPHTWDAYYRVEILGKETAAQVAQDLGISVNSVHVAVNRVGAMLREERTKLLDTQGDRTKQDGGT
jgi:RNA polymerase sigma factor (sigma-70 family)